MANNDEAQKAIDALNEVELEGRALAVNEARPKNRIQKTIWWVVATAVAVAVATTKVATTKVATVVAMVVIKKDINRFNHTESLR